MNTMTKERGLTIHFIDGSKMQLEFPPQAENEYGAILKLKEVLKDRQLMIEVDGALLLMPFDNIKYVQVYPVPTDKLPPNVVRGARMST
jgi:hypothetical protein